MDPFIFLEKLFAYAMQLYFPHRQISFKNLKYVYSVQFIKIHLIFKYWYHKGLS